MRATNAVTGVQRKVGVRVVAGGVQMAASVTRVTEERMPMKTTTMPTNPTFLHPETSSSGSSLVS